MITSIKIGLRNHRTFGFMYREGRIEFVGDALATQNYKEELAQIKSIIEKISKKERRDRYDNNRRL